MFEDVVVGVRSDGDGRDAISLARELASPQAQLVLFHVHVVTSKPAPDSGARRDAEHRRHALALLTALRAEFSLAAEVSWVTARSVRRGLHEFALDRHADLLVVGASHFDELSRELVGDDTREVLQDAPCAVAVAPPGYAASAAPMRRIGVAYGGSKESARALAAGRRLAAERHAELSAIEAVETPLGRDPANVRGEVEEDVEDARQRLARLTDMGPHVAYGDAVQVLARYGESVDLLVVGSHKYRPIDHLLQQSTGQRLADRATFPLLVLPSSARAGG